MAATDKITLRLSPRTLAQGQSAVKLGERFYGTEPTDVDTLDEATKDAIKRGILDATGLSDELRSEIFGEVADPMPPPQVTAPVPVVFVSPPIGATK